MTIDDRIADVAALVGLLLGLVTLFTSAEAAALREARVSARPERARPGGRAALAVGLAAVTTLVLLSALPLWWEAATHLHPLRGTAAARSVFVLAWLLLVPLAAWQLSLARAWWRLRSAA